MERMKVNTLNNEATTLFRKNLINSKAEFKQLGSAFIVDELVSSFHPDAFNGLWQGYDANIEIQDIEDYDQSVSMYVHQGS